MTKLPDLLYASLEDINAGLAAKDFTSVDLTLAYIARLQEVNPELNAVLEINAVRLHAWLIIQIDTSVVCGSGCC